MTSAKKIIDREGNITGFLPGTESDNIAQLCRIYSLCQRLRIISKFNLPLILDKQECEYLILLLEVDAVAVGKKLGEIIQDEITTEEQEIINNGLQQELSSVSKGSDFS
jgi:hypothetical protein